MARKPIEFEYHNSRTQRDRLWAAARELRQFTLMEWQDAVRDPVVPFTTCETYQQALLAAGYIEVITPGRRGDGGKLMAARYAVVKDSLAAPRVMRRGQAVTQGSGTLAMWRAMQILGTFDWHDVQRAASHPELQVSPLTAKKYVVQLAGAGYFQVLKAAEPGTAARYRLARNTGPHAPAVTRDKRVFDRNLGTFFEGL